MAAQAGIDRAVIHAGPAANAAQHVFHVAADQPGAAGVDQHDVHLFRPVTLAGRLDTGGQGKVVGDRLADGGARQQADQGGEIFQRLDAVLQVRVAELQTIITQFEELRDEQRRKDLVDSILRLRRQRLRKSCRDLELLLRSVDAADPDQGELGRQLVDSAQQQKMVERALHARSHTGRWIKDQQRVTW